MIDHDGNRAAAHASCHEDGDDGDVPTPPSRLCRLCTTPTIARWRPSDARPTPRLPRATANGPRLKNTETKYEAAESAGACPVQDIMLTIARAAAAVGSPVRGPNAAASPVKTCVDKATRFLGHCVVRRTTLRFPPHTHSRSTSLVASSLGGASTRNTAMPLSNWGTGSDKFIEAVLEGSSRKRNLRVMLSPGLASPSRKLSETRQSESAVKGNKRKIGPATFDMDAVASGNCATC
jgi:hypothetical protein